MQVRNAATKVTATVVKWVYGVDHQLEQAVSKVGPGVQHVDPAVRGPGKKKKPVCWPISADPKIKKTTKEPPKNLHLYRVTRFSTSILCTKDSTWATQEQAKTVSLNFSFSRRNSLIKFENHVSRVRVVNNHADTRFSRISSRKRKISRNCFLPVHMGPRQSFLINKSVEKVVTLSL